MAVIGDSFMAKLLDEAYELLKDEVVLLSGAASEIERLQDTFRSLQLVLADADRKKIEDGAVKKWLMDLKDVMYDADDVLDECRVKAERHKKLSSTSTRFSPRPYFHKIVWGYQIKRRIQNLNARLSEIGDERSKFGLSTEFRAKASPPQISRKTSHLADPDIVGSAIEEDTNKLVELMINDGQNENLVVHSVVGIGGIGKTTIARSIHNDERITAHFKIKIWLSITKDFTDVDLLSSVARMLFKQYPMYHQTDLISQNASRDCLEPAINRIVRGRRFFIVLDDLWSEEVWYDLLRNPLQGGAAGSCILITTRNVGIAEKIDAINIHMMQPMSSVDGWALLRKKVTSIGEEDDVKALEDIGLEIVKKCGGLPLAIRAIGGVLRNKKKRRSEWEDTLQNANWSVNWLPEGVHAALYLSYEDLPSHLKECFHHVCLFPLAPFVHKHDLIQYWIAEGFIKGHGGKSLEDLGMEYCVALLERGLLQPDPSCYGVDICRVHDVLQLLARFLTQDESLVQMQQRNWIVGDNCIGSSSSTSIKPRRLSTRISHGDVKPMLDFLEGNNHLRTLILRSSKLEDEDTNSLLQNATQLRVLDLRWSKITKLPGSIGLMIHLRLLVLMDSTITELPENIGDLVNLQFLRTQGCENLKKLPKGIVKLQRLRCLDLYDTEIESVPQGIGELQQLNVLQGFVVSRPNLIGVSSSSLADLRTLTSLRTLTVHMLEQMLHGLIIEKSVLSEMVQLRDLELNFKCDSYHISRDVNKLQDQEINKIQEILGVSLFPPPSIEIFEINGFFGRQLPSWLMLNTASLFLPQLTRLKLCGCLLIEHLPPLGVLPSLEHLEIREAPKIKIIGNEFFGQSSSRPFPKLTSLVFNNMVRWKEWEISENYGPTAFPQLRFLELDYCVSLKSFPTGISCGSVSLKRLCIKQCVRLSEISGFPSVETMILTKYVLPWFTGFPSLKILVIDNEGMDCFPDWFYEASRELQKLIIVCKLDLLQRCFKEGPDWPIIQQIPYVHIHSTCTNNYLHKSPSSYSTGIGSANCLETYCKETQPKRSAKADYLCRQWGELR